jgi:hypothetical protein
LRPDLNFATRTFGSSHTVLIDISCPSGPISYETNTSEKGCIEKKTKSSRPAQKTSNLREMQIEIIPIIVSLLGAVHARSFEAFRNLFLCNDKAMKKIGRRLTEATVAVSMERWGRFV